MMKKLCCCLAAFLTMMLLLPAHAQEITVEAVSTRFGENGVSYPQLKGMEDEAVQKKINDDIVLSSGVTTHMITMATLGGSSVGLNVEYQVCLMTDEVFSALISAKGKLPGRRDGQEWTALTYDLRTGERLSLEQVFTDVNEVIAKMEQIAEASLSEEFSGYMEYADVLPLPVDSFTLDENGITFWYPWDQFSLLSGYSGACQFWTEELDGLWRGETQDMTDEQIREAIARTVRQGKLPKVPVAMGESMQEAAESYRLLRTPDEFPGGRYFVMEDPKFRQVLLLSDNLYADYEQSVVEGIQLRRGGLCGLLIGQTEQNRWRAILGQPEKTVDFSENMAYDYNLPAGQYDVYRFGENELRLHADENGVLCAVQLSR